MRRLLSVLIPSTAQELWAESGICQRTCSLTGVALEHGCKFVTVVRCSIHDPLAALCAMTDLSDRKISI